jgi:hypothetical protein
MSLLEKKEKEKANSIYIQYTKEKEEILHCINIKRKKEKSFLYIY